MKKLYQRTFEQVLAQTCPPLNRVEEQRRALASRCSHTESEVTAMTTKPRRPIRILVAAAAVAAAEEALGEDGRVLLRPSGTEPVVRVMVEAVDPAAAQAHAEAIAAVVEACV